MRIFGRKANQQSTKSDVPPELQPYYAVPSARRGWRRAALFILPLLVLLLLIGGIIWAIASSRHQKLSDLFGKPSTQTQQSQTTPSTPPSSSSQNQQSQGSTGQTPSNQPSTNNQQPQTGTNPNQQGGGATGGTNQNAAPSTIPNTGPDDASVIGLATATASAGAMLYHVRQVRRAKRAS